MTEVLKQLSKAGLKDFFWKKFQAFYSRSFQLKKSMV